MKVNADRLSRLLHNDKFELLWKDKHNFNFVRRSKKPQLFEHLYVTGQGKKGEVVYATTAVSAVRLFAPHASVAVTDLNLMVALESDKERHWTLIASLKEARNWETRLAEIAGSFVSRTADKLGNELLERLRDTLSRRDHYIAAIGDAAQIFSREHAYYEETPATVRAQGERIAFYSCHQSTAREDVNLAALILARFGPEIEGVPNPWKDVDVSEPKTDMFLMPMILLLADYLHMRRGT